MPRDLSTDPKDRLGVFKRYEEVPQRYRLYQHQAEYQGRDVWQEFLNAELLAEEWSDRYEQDVRRAGKLWKEHLESRDTHHALATPEDVETWVSGLLQDRNRETVYLDYWAKLEQFYDWLLYHPDHPHVYHPFLMAAVEGDAAGDVWQTKVTRRDQYD